MPDRSASPHYDRDSLLDDDPAFLPIAGGRLGHVPPRPIPRRAAAPIPIPDRDTLATERRERLAAVTSTEFRRRIGCFESGVRYAKRQAQLDSAYWVLAGILIGGFVMWLFAVAGFVGHGR